ncbi:hypothetical protein TNCV_929851 [Trichonephila clavipes]|nr:hypothetical protein TNCV_929851 [Trichonephila clavipes]
MGHSIPEVTMKFRFSHTTISRMYCEYRESLKNQIYDITAAGKKHMQEDQRRLTRIIKEPGHARKSGGGKFMSPQNIRAAAPPFQ